MFLTRAVEKSAVTSLKNIIFKRFERAVSLVLLVFNEVTALVLKHKGNERHILRSECPMPATLLPPSKSDIFLY